MVKGQTIRKLMGEGGGGEVQKKYSREGKLNEKNSCTPINPKKYSCQGLKKNHTRNLTTKKSSCGSKIPRPPHKFSNGPSLNLFETIALLKEDTAFMPLSKVRGY